MFLKAPRFAIGGEPLDADPQVVNPDLNLIVVVLTNQVRFNLDFDLTTRGEVNHFG